LRYSIFSLSTRTVPAALSTLSLHDALPICAGLVRRERFCHLPDAPVHHDAAARARRGGAHGRRRLLSHPLERPRAALQASAGDADRKSTRLNSSHQIISYAVFCLKKKKKKQ